MAIELHNIQFCYPQHPDQLVLEITQWSLAAGEQVFLHGPSGSGKSTFLNLISGMLVPQQGQVNVLGQRLDTMRQRQRDRFRANNIGYVFQQFNLIPYLNARDNIHLAAHFSHTQKKSSTEQHSAALLDALGLERSVWTRPTRALSMGQQQRVAIARALINQPQLLIADEPTSSLDEKNRDAFMQLLLSAIEHSNTALVLVSHDMALAQYFKRQQSLAEMSAPQGVSHVH